MRIWRILLEPQGGEGNGNTGTETKAEPKVEAKGGDLSKAAEGLVAKHGDPTAALLVLLGENYSLRDKNRELGARVPGDGAVVLKDEEAKDWQHYRGLGKPAELKTALADRDTFKAKAEGFERADLVRTVAEVSKFKPGVLATLIDRDKLAVEVVEDKDKDGKPTKDKDGAPVRVAVVKGEGDKVTRLDEYARAKWGDFLPSLVAQPPQEKPKGTPRFEATRQGGNGDTTPPRTRPIPTF